MSVKYSDEFKQQAGQKDRGEAPTLEARLNTLSRCMSINKHKAMASEYVDEQVQLKSEKNRQKQASLSSDNELAA